MGLALLSRLPGFTLANQPSKEITKEMKRDNPRESKQRNLTHAGSNQPCVIKEIRAEEKGIKEFLFTLGCFEGETITVISTLADNYIIHVKDARYSIDADLAKSILI